jgi:hypothetical protein
MNISMSRFVSKKISGEPTMRKPEAIGPDSQKPFKTFRQSRMRGLESAVRNGADKALRTAETGLAVISIEIVPIPIVPPPKLLPLMVAAPIERVGVQRSIWLMPNHQQKVQPQACRNVEFLFSVRHHFGASTKHRPCARTSAGNGPPVIWSTIVPNP